MKTTKKPIDALDMSRRLRIASGTKLRSMSCKARLRYLHQKWLKVHSRLRRNKAKNSSRSEE